MKTEEQIKAKIQEHEDHINILLSDEIDEATHTSIENYLKGRKALLWALSDEDYITPDEYEKRIEFELLCYESTKIF